MCKKCHVVKKLNDDYFPRSYWNIREYGNICKDCKNIKIKPM